LIDRQYGRAVEARPRQIAYRALRHADAPGDFLEHRLEADPDFGRLPPPDRRLAQELVYGILRQRAALDWIIARRTDGRRQKHALQDLLRLGIYQLFFLDRVPPHAAVNETVVLAREAGFDHQSGFLNAVLRGCDRDRDRIRTDLAALRESDPAVAWSHPRWLVDRWRQRLGDVGLRRLLDWDNSPPPTYARVNTLRTDVAQLRIRWAAEGVEAVPFERDWTHGLCFELASHPPLGSLPSFCEGHFYVQDPSTLLAVHLLDPRPGERILDLCAAPGGKATLIAQFLGNQGAVVAHDSQPARLRLVGENATRLGASCVQTLAPDEFGASPGLFDRILVDAPCSNTGVLRRRLELRWRVHASEIPRLQSAQSILLDQASQWLRPGGTLAYSTCSFEPEENSAVADGFLARHPEFVPGPRREVGPLEHGVDGAFVAVFVKSAGPTPA
jgi:16S rRNA (cytosine967-C5)-methyltransferase